MSKKERSYILDFLRGFAIYLVVANHLANAFWGTNAVTQIIALVHLPLFFVISGYLFNMSRKRKSMKEIIVNKLKTLLWPYVAWSSIALVVAIITNRSLDVMFINNEISEIFFYGRSVWFLLTLFLVEVFFVVSFAVTDKLEGIAKLALFIAIYALVCVLLPDAIFQLNKFKVYSVYFAIGLILNEYDTIFKKIYEVVKRWYVVYFVAFVAGAVWVVNTEYANYMVNFRLEKITILVIPIYFVTLCGMMSALRMAELLQSSKIFEIVCEFGICSLDIYVIHMFFVKVIAAVLSLFLLPNAMLLAITFCIAGVVSMVISKLKIWLLGKIRLYTFLLGK